MICKYCGESMEYQGIDDGGGDYGSSICDQWYCTSCDWQDENHCAEIEDESLYTDELPMDYTAAGPLGITSPNTGPVGVEGPAPGDLDDFSDIPF